MLSIGMKGSIGVILAGAAIILMLFTISTTDNNSVQNETLFKIQVAKEAALKTENLVRLLDKATSRVILRNMDTVCTVPRRITSEFQSEYNRVVNEFSNNQGNLFDCEINVINSTERPAFVSVQGTLNCTSVINNFRVTDSREWVFEKVPSNVGTVTPSCIVTDYISGCQEQPTFRCN